MDDRNVIAAWHPTTVCSTASTENNISGAAPKSNNDRTVDVFIETGAPIVQCAHPISTAIA